MASQCQMPPSGTHSLVMTTVAFPTQPTTNTASRRSGASRPTSSSSRCASIRSRRRWRSSATCSSAARAWSQTSRCRPWCANRAAARPPRSGSWACSSAAAPLASVPPRPARTASRRATGRTSAPTCSVQRCHGRRRLRRWRSPARRRRGGQERREALRARSRLGAQMQFV